MPASQAITVATIIAVTLGVGICFTTFVIWGLSYLTGWRTLAAQFPAREPLPNAAKVFGSIGLRAMGNYNNCIRYRMDDEYLHVSIIPFFNLGHQPLSIPWAAIEITKAKPLWGYAKLRIANMDVRVPQKVIARELELRGQLQSLEVPGGSSDAQIAARNS